MAAFSLKSFLCLFYFFLLNFVSSFAGSEVYVSIVGDPLMADYHPRVMIEGWNFCNMAGNNCTVAPRWADCSSEDGPGPFGNNISQNDNDSGLTATSTQAVCEPFTEQKERNLGSLCEVTGPAGNTSYFWTGMLKSGNFDTWEEGVLCGLWCEPNCSDSRAAPSSFQSKGPLQFDNLAMNQPNLFHEWSSLDESNNYAGGFYGTWDLGASQDSVEAAKMALHHPLVSTSQMRFNTRNLFAEDGVTCNLAGLWVGSDPITIMVQQYGNQLNISCSMWGNVTRSGFVYQNGSVVMNNGIEDEPGVAEVLDGVGCAGIFWQNGGTWCKMPFCSAPPLGMSFYSLDWFVRDGVRVYRNMLKTSNSYPWLMLYFGADAATGPKGGYPWDGRGMMWPLPISSPNFTSNNVIVKFFLNITAWQSDSSFYFINMCSCWKMNGSQCDGDITTDVTRYILLDLSASSSSMTNPQPRCSHERQDLCPRFHRYPNGTLVLPSQKDVFPYHVYVSVGGFDPYSNPQQQDFIKLAPSPEWAVYGFPNSTAQGLVPGFWELNVAALTASIPMEGEEPLFRQWTTFNIGPEMGLGGASAALSLWEVSLFDVLVPEEDLATLVSHSS